jgi:hypothetical protein
VFIFVVNTWNSGDLTALLSATATFSDRFQAGPSDACCRHIWRWSKHRSKRLFADELASPLSAMTFAELRWYFEQRQDRTSTRASADADRFRRAERAFAGRRWRLLFSRWLSDGDSALDVATSPAVRDALMRGDGLIQIAVLPHSYRQLSPLASLVRARVRRVEKGERAPGRPQPPTSARGAAFSAALEGGSELR